LPLISDLTAKIQEGFEVITAVDMKISIFWDVTSTDYTALYLGR
jgi:hypothetical protein